MFVLNPWIAVNIQQFSHAVVSPCHDYLALQQPRLLPWAFWSRDFGYKVLDVQPRHGNDCFRDDHHLGQDSEIFARVGLFVSSHVDALAGMFALRTLTFLSPKSPSFSFYY